MYEPQACIKKKCFKKQFILFMEIVTHYIEIHIFGTISFFGLYICIHLFMEILFEKTDIKNAIKCVSIKKENCK